MKCCGNDLYKIVQDILDEAETKAGDLGPNLILIDCKKCGAKWTFAPWTCSWSKNGKYIPYEDSNFERS